MSSRNKRVIFNNLERAVSGDWTRVQNLTTRGYLEGFRGLLGMRRTADAAAFPGVRQTWSTPPAGSIPHLVLGGCMVRPDNGTHLLVDSGVVAYNVPGANSAADDSDFMIATAPALTNTTVLPFTANATGNVRVDVVECRVVDTLTAVETRDILNPSVPSFAPLQVEKERAGIVEYRIALGSGAGVLRDPSPDWIPLAIVFVQPGASGFQQCDIYDVRPLANSLDFNRPDKPITLDVCEFHAQDALLAGYYEATFMGWKVGGMMRQNHPTTLANFGTHDGSGVWDIMNFNATDWQTAGVAGASDEFIQLMAVFPKGYPRWVRYSQISINAGAVSGRLPHGCGGILVQDVQASMAASDESDRQWTNDFCAVPELAGTHPALLLGYVYKPASGSRLLPRGNLASGFFFSQLDLSLSSGSFPRNASGYSIASRIASIGASSQVVGSGITAEELTVTFKRSVSERRWPLAARAVFAKAFCSGFTGAVDNYWAFCSPRSNDFMYPLGGERRDLPSAESNFVVWCGEVELHRELVSTSPTGAIGISAGLGKISSSLTLKINTAFPTRPVPTDALYIYGYRL